MEGMEPMGLLPSDVSSEQLDPREHKCGFVPLSDLEWSKDPQKSSGDGNET